MKHNIRRSVFETNSSSVHTIAIGKYDIEFHDEIWFKVGQFGWEQDKYTDISDKASYLWTAIVQLYEDSPNELKDWKTYISETLGSEGIKTVFYMPKSNDFYYIDHAYNLKEWLNDIRSDKEMLTNYILSPQTVIYTGNDNGDLPEVMEGNLDNSMYYNIITKGN